MTIRTTSNFLLTMPLMANVDAAFMKKVFDIAKRKRKSDLHHHRKENDLRRCLEIPEWIMIFHSKILSNC